MAIDKTMAEQVAEQQREQMFPSSTMGVQFKPRTGAPLDGMRYMLEKLIHNGAFVRPDRAQAAYDATEEIITLAEKAGTQVRPSLNGYAGQQAAACRDAFSVSLAFILMGFMNALGVMDDEQPTEGDDAQRGD